MKNGTRLRVVMLALLLVVWAVSLHRLTVFPPVNEDEPWIASTGWQIATRGVFGSPLFAGLWHMDERYYDFMPLYPMVSAILFRVAEVGLFQARFVSVMLGTLTLALTFRAGQQLVNAQAGLVAALTLVLLPLMVPPYSTGSLFLDVTRVARYDILVPVCGLSALLIYWRGTHTKSLVPYTLAGLMAGFAGLAHIYGAFWFPVLVALALLTGVRRLPVLALVLGFAVPWSLYGVYVASGWTEFRAQTRWYGDRFGLTDLHWYWSNLQNELSRYQFPNYLAAAITVFVLGVGILVLMDRARRDPESNAAYILVPTVILSLGLAVFVETKAAPYLIMVVPLFGLLVGFLFETITRQMSLPFARRILLTGTTAAGMVLLGIHALTLENAAQQTTPYQTIVSELRAGISPPERVLGLHAFWFGLQDVDMRDWIVPLQWSAPRDGVTRMTMTQALDRLAPDALVIDPRMRAYFINAGTDTRPLQITAWLKTNTFQCALQFQDSTYGEYRVYRRMKQATPGAFIAPCPTH